MAKNRAMIESSLVAAGFCVNARGGAYENGVARPIQDKAAVAQRYFDLEENLLAGEQISVLSLAAWLGIPAEFRRNSAEFRIPHLFLRPFFPIFFRFRSESAFPPFF